MKEKIQKTRLGCQKSRWLEKKAQKRLGEKTDGLRKAEKKLSGIKSCKCGEERPVCQGNRKKN